MPKIVIIGGGFAGASTAYSLTNAGYKDVIILEAEFQCGCHASGLNASMARQVVEDSVIRNLTVKGAEFIREISKQGFLDFHMNGSLLLYQEKPPQGYEDILLHTLEQNVPVSILSRKSVCESIPILSDALFTHAIFTENDGVVDVAGLLSFYLKESKQRGAKVLTSCPAIGIETQSQRVKAVITPAGRIECDVVVNAGGAWANQIAGLAHIPPLCMNPYKRHLILTPPLSFVDNRWPFVWDITHDYYFRPELGGLLLSPCDEKLSQPGKVPPDTACLETLAKKLMAFAPSLSNISIKTYWAGLRTITKDHRFVIGWDKDLEGFFWVAGLGGHGMTSSYAVGELAVKIFRSSLDEKDFLLFSPQRLK